MTSLDAVISRAARSLRRVGDGPERERLKDWMRVLSWGVFLGAVFIGLYGVSAAPTFAVGVRVIAGGLMLAGASLLMGGFVGFLFGIPRTLQDPAAAAAAAANPAQGAQGAPGPVARYAANTNLEQISDWLTKMLVGVGLTQLRDAPGHLSSAATFFAPTLADGTHGRPFAMALILFFATAGFLFSYLWTRLYLALAMHFADAAGEVRKQLEARDVIDAQALSLTRQQIEPADDAPPIDPAKLREAIMGASPAVKVQVYYFASQKRAETWRNNKPLMERTIPIFEALVASDTEHRFHKNFGQLGFALKDKEPPDWAGAERNLSEAIRIRGPWVRNGWVIYEFNRAICRIMQDPQHAAKAPAGAAARDAIVADLAAASSSDLRPLLDEEPIAGWMRLNKVTDSKLRQAVADAEDAGGEPDASATE